MRRWLVVVVAVLVAAVCGGGVWGWRAWSADRAADRAAAAKDAAAQVWGEPERVDAFLAQLADAMGSVGGLTMEREEYVDLGLAACGEYYDGETFKSLTRAWVSGREIDWGPQSREELAGQLVARMSNVFAVGMVTASAALELCPELETGL